MRGGGAGDGGELHPRGTTQKSGAAAGATRGGQETCEEAAATAAAPGPPPGTNPTAGVVEIREPDPVAAPPDPPPPLPEDEAAAHSPGTGPAATAAASAAAPPTGFVFTASGDTGKSPETAGLWSKARDAYGGARLGAHRHRVHKPASGPCTAAAAPPSVDASVSAMVTALRHISCQLGERKARQRE